MNNNTIKGLFYKVDTNEIKQYAQELNTLEYFLEFKLVTTLNHVKSEILNNTWNMVLLDGTVEQNDMEEILDFIHDTNRNISILVLSKSINKPLLEFVLQKPKMDIVRKDNLNQLAYSIINNFEKTQTLNQNEFAKKELIRLQKTQSEHDHFLNQVIESTSNPIFYKGTEGRYFGCNTAFANFIGLPKNEIIGKTVFEIAPKEFARKYHKMDQEFFENPVTQQYEYKVANMQGEIMDVVFYKSAIRDDNGNVVGLLGHMFDISDRKKLETDLKREKELAQKILDTSDEMFVSMDLHGNITSVNKKTCDVFRCGKQHLIGKNWFSDIIPKDEVEVSKESFKEIISKSANHRESVHRKIITFDKQEKQVSWKIGQIADAEGNISGVLISGREMHGQDITHKLEMSEKRYQLLIENMQEGIGIADLNENVVFSNAAFDKIFGFEPGEMVGKNLKDFIIEEEMEKVFKETGKRKSNLKSVYKLAIKRKDSKQRVINVSSVPWKDNKDQIIGAIGMVTDITTHDYFTKRLESKVKIEQSIVKISSQFISTENFDDKLNFALKELHTIIEAERYGMLIVKDNSITLNAEQHFSGSTNMGVEFQPIEYKKFQFALKMLESLDFIFIDDITKLPEEAKTEKEIFTQHRIFNFLGIPFYSQSKLAGILAISNIYNVNEWTIEDLSLLRTVADVIGHAYHRKIAEDKAQSLKYDLITKNKELEQVVYVTSHDIRSPVVNILGFSDEMIKALNKLTNKVFDEANTIQNRGDIEYLINKDIPQILNFIKISGQKIDKLLLALLKLSRLGRAAINKANVNMNELMSSLLSTFEYKVKELDIEIQTENLHNCYTDEVQINQVFSNIIDNAIKYRSPQRKAVIKISSQQNNNKITYCIEDNGIGIPESELDKIFDVFYRIDPENQEGEGMGLALIKKTIERLDGDISVGSVQGEGTKFYISLEKQKA